MSEKKISFAILALLFKLLPKFFGIFSKLFKTLKFGKVALAGASFAGYAVIFNWKFALLLMVALAFHESGHVWAMKKSGIKTKGFYFIPFLGGAAIASEKYKTQAQHSFISIMGPIWGGGLAILTLLIYYLTNNIFFAAAAGWMAVLNLFNLLPINPLDGGQLLNCIATSLHRKLGIFVLAGSLVMCIVLFHFLGLGLFVLLFIIGGLDLLFEWEPWRKKTSRELEREKNNNPLPLTKQQMSWTVASYVVTVVLLLGVSYLTKHIPGADIAHTFLK